MTTSRSTICIASVVCHLHGFTQLHEMVIAMKRRQSSSIIGRRVIPKHAPHKPLNQL